MAKKKEFTIDGNLAVEFKRSVSKAKQDINSVKDTLGKLARSLETFSVPLEAVSYLQEENPLSDPDFAAKLSEHFESVFRLVCEARAFLREQIISQYNVPDAKRLADDELYLFGENSKEERAALQEAMTKRLLEFDATLYSQLIFSGNWNKQGEILETGAIDFGAILSAAEEKSPLLASVLRENLFSAETLLRLDNRAVQIVLRELNKETVEKALKVSSEKVREKVFSNCSKKMKAILQEEMEYMCIRRSEGIEASGKVGAVIARLLSDHNIKLMSNKEEFV